MKKTIVIKAKTNLQSQAITKNIDLHYFQGFWSTYTTATKDNTQGQLIKNFAEEELKV